MENEINTSQDGNIKLNSDNILEVLIILEEIQKKLKKGVCPMRIINDEPIIFEYHSGAIYLDLVGKNFKPYHHYEKVSIDIENNEYCIKWLDVIDTMWPHYTPKFLKFSDMNDITDFLRKRYLDNKWGIRKLKPGRYLIDDDIDDIPEHMR